MLLINSEVRRSTVFERCIAAQEQAAVDITKLQIFMCAVMHLQEQKTRKNFSNRLNCTHFLKIFKICEVKY